MFHQNILAQAANLLDGSLVDDTFMVQPDVKQAEDGSRLFTELNTGLWWEKTVQDDFMPLVNPKKTAFFRF